jgi:ATP-dependent helicase YprA (DUF1998 family)
MVESHQEQHERLHAKSYRNLAKAREEAVRKKTYDTQTRSQLKQIFYRWFGKDLYEWQLDVTEAILLGLNSVVIAGTGAGKTMPFMMPLLLDAHKKVIIISPLKVLQVDQVRALFVFLSGVGTFERCTRCSRSCELSSHQISPFSQHRPHVHLWHCALLFQWWLG